jgi:hypothetical protein
MLVATLSPNYSVNMDAQLRCATWGTGYAGRSAPVQESLDGDKEATIRAKASPRGPRAPRR